MESKNSFVIYTSWRSFFELLEEPELIKELLYTMFDIAEGKETAVTNNRVKSALKAIEPKMKEDLEAYEARCEKNRKAAQKRWGNPSDMHSHADVMQTDGDTDNDTDSDTDTESDNDTDIDMSVMSGSDAPSVADVMEFAHNHKLDLSEEDAKEFIDYYFMDRKGMINGEPIKLRGYCRHESHPEFGPALPLQVAFLLISAPYAVLLSPEVSVVSVTFS